jgi:hypothetical protein
MANWVWDIVLFSWGIVAGLGIAAAVVVVTRMHREARREGEQLVARLGSIDTRRFIAAVTE